MALPVRCSLHTETGLDPGGTHSWTDESLYLSTWQYSHLCPVKLVSIQVQILASCPTKLEHFFVLFLITSSSWTPPNVKVLKTSYRVWLTEFQVFLHNDHKCSQSGELSLPFLFQGEREKKKKKTFFFHGILCLDFGSKIVTLCSLMLVSIKFTWLVCCLGGS